MLVGSARRRAIVTSNTEPASRIRAWVSGASIEAQLRPRPRANATPARARDAAAASAASGRRPVILRARVRPWPRDEAATAAGTASPAGGREVRCRRASAAGADVWWRGDQITDCQVLGMPALLIAYSLARQASRASGCARRLLAMEFRK